VQLGTRLPSRGAAPSSVKAFSLPAMSLAFDEYGRPFIIVRVRRGSPVSRRTPHASARPRDERETPP
jgi:hypothetical protein